MKKLIILSIVALGACATPRGGPSAFDGVEVEMCRFHPADPLCANAVPTAARGADGVVTLDAQSKPVSIIPATKAEKKRQRRKGGRALVSV